MATRRNRPPSIARLAREVKQVEITAPDGITWRLRLSDIAA